MEINALLKINISLPNLGLIPLVIQGLNYEDWAKEKIEAGRQIAYSAWEALNTEELFEFDESTVDVSVDTFIKFFIKNDIETRYKGIIFNPIAEYNGKVMANQTEAIKSQIEDAVLCTVTITRD